MFNIMVPSTSVSSKSPLPIRLCNKNFIRISHLSHARYMPIPSYVFHLVDLIILREDHGVSSCSLCSCIQPPLHHSCVQTVPSNVFLKAFKLCSSRSVRDLVKAKAVPLHAMKALEGRGSIAPVHS
jgi:hypothetical protein